MKIKKYQWIYYSASCTLVNTNFSNKTSENNVINMFLNVIYLIVDKKYVANNTFFNLIFTFVNTSSYAGRK